MAGKTGKPVKLQLYDPFDVRHTTIDYFYPDEPLSLLIKPCLATGHSLRDFKILSSKGTVIDVDQKVEKYRAVIEKEKIMIFNFSKENLVPSKFLGSRFKDISFSVPNQECHMVECELLTKLAPNIRLSPKLSSLEQSYENAKKFYVNAQSLRQDCWKFLHTIRIHLFGQEALAHYCSREIQDCRRDFEVNQQHIREKLSEYDITYADFDKAIEELENLPADIQIEEGKHTLKAFIDNNEMQKRKKLSLQRRNDVEKRCDNVHTKIDQYEQKVAELVQSGGDLGKHTEDLEVTLKQINSAFETVVNDLNQMIRPYERLCKLMKDLLADDDDEREKRLAEFEEEIFGEEGKTKLSESVAAGQKSMTEYETLTQKLKKIQAGRKKHLISFREMICSSRIRTSVKMLKDLALPLQREVLFLMIPTKFPDCYKEAINEVVRRKNFARMFTMMQKIFQAMIQGEHARRAQFHRHFGKYLPDSFIPALRYGPPQFRVESQEIDESLPDLSTMSAIAPLRLDDFIQDDDVFGSFKEVNDQAANQISELQSQIDMYSQDCERARKDLTQCRSEIKKLQEALDNYRALNEELNSTCGVLASEKEQLQHMNHKLEQEIQSYTYSKGLYIDEAVSELKSKLEEKDCEIKLLHDSIKEMHPSTLISRNLGESQNEEMSEMRLRNDQLQRLNAELTDELGNIRACINGIHEHGQRVLQGGQMDQDYVKKLSFESVIDTICDRYIDSLNKMEQLRREKSSLESHAAMEPNSISLSRLDAGVLVIGLRIKGGVFKIVQDKADFPAFFVDEAADQSIFGLIGRVETVETKIATGRELNLRAHEKYILTHLQVTCCIYVNGAYQNVKK